MSIEHGTFNRSSHGVFIRSDHGDARGVIGDLVIGGDFFRADGNICFRVCILRNGEYDAIFEGGDSDVNSDVFDVIEYKKELYIGGSFTGGIRKLNKETEKFDIVGGGISAFSQVLNMVVFGDLLIIVGNFSNAGGVADTAKVAAWDGTNWLTMYSPPLLPDWVFVSGAVTDCHVFEGELYVCGPYRFWENGAPLLGLRILARFTGSGWANAFEFEPGEGNALRLVTYNGEMWMIGGTVGLTIFPSGATIDKVGTIVSGAVVGSKIVLGGLSNFDEIEGVACESVAQFSPATGWEAVGDGFNASSDIRDIIEYKKEMYITGDFSINAGDDFAENIVKLDKKNNTWIRSSSGSGLLSEGLAMTIIKI